MLRIFNTLRPFFEDNYREIGVREYSRIMKTSAPTASKLLKEFEGEGLIKKRLDRGYLFFRANRENLLLKDLSKSYWRQRLNKVIDKINDEYYNPAIVLFGSLIKLETKQDSDIDLAVFTNLKKKVDLSEYENILGREIQLFTFESLSKVNKELKSNLVNGHILQGDLK